MVNFLCDEIGTTLKVLMLHFLYVCILERQVKDSLYLLPVLTHAIYCSHAPSPKLTHNQSIQQHGITIIVVRIQKMSELKVSTMI